MRLPNSVLPPLVYMFYVLLLVDLKRSKSTPGLVESAGKVPMEAASITRHHTLPAGLPTHSSSIDQHILRSHEVLSGSPTEAQTSIEPAGTTQPSGQQQTDHQETTRIRTVSSVTSFLTGSPLVTSPLPVDNQAPMFHFSPPLTPGPPLPYASPYHVQHNPNIASNVCAPGTASYNEFIPRDVSHDYGIRAPAQFPQAYFPYPHYTQPIPSTGLASSNTQHPMAFLSPFCASTGFVSPISPNISHPRTGIPSASPTQSNSNSTTRRGSSQQAAGTDGHIPSSSVQMFSEASHDSLVQEITRLRERLKSVESENVVMAAKLNQQQWELEHRLSELEMQMTCTSDMASTGSPDDPSNPFENISRESII